MDAIIGIDFGSSACRTAVFRDGRAELFPNRFSERLQSAQRESPSASDASCCLNLLPICFRSLKQKAGIEQAVADGLTDLFKQLMEDARTALGQQVSGVVLGVPGFFPERPRLVLRETAFRAGIPALRLFDEALGAVLGSSNTLAQGTLLVYSLGAGTFSATVINTTNGKPRVLSSEGNRFLGGNDFDAAIIGVILDKLGRNRNMPGFDDAAMRLKTIAEQVKIGLSRREQEEIDLNLVDLFGDSGGIERFVLTRGEFERAIESAVDTTMALSQKAVEAAGVATASIDRILMVGGSTRIPLIERRLMDQFSAPRIRASDGAVASGAAIQGGQLRDTDWKKNEPEATTPQKPTSMPHSAAPDKGTWLALFSPAMFEAETLWKGGDQPAAIAVFERMLHQEQQYLGTLHHELGQALSRKHQFDQAILHLEKAIKCSPQDRFAYQTYHETLKGKAIELCEAGHLQDARTVINRALKIIPDCPSCLQVSERIDQALRAGHPRGSTFPYRKKGKKK